MGVPSPPTMRAQLVTSSKGGIEKNLHIASAPLPKRKPDQHLIKVIAAAINPVDYKGIELPLMVRFVLPKPVIPGTDIVGRIVEPAEGSSFQPGQLVFGGAGFSPTAGAALAEYTLAAKDGIAALPEGLDPILASTIYIAGATAYQSIVPFVKEGSKVFINGGSGGTGIFGIQIAKAKGCYVTTTCSTGNVELVRSLGADEVIDYRKQNVVETLTTGSTKYDHIVDNIGEQLELYWKAHEYSNPKATFVIVGLDFSFKSFGGLLTRLLRPGFLGGGKRKQLALMAAPKKEELEHIAEWVKSGHVKPIIDSKFSFEDAPKAFEKIKTHRAKGKIIVEVNPKA